MKQSQKQVEHLPSFDKAEWDELDVFEDSASFSEDVNNEKSFRPNLDTKEAYQEFSAAFFDASMALAAQNGWNGFTLTAVAQDADIPLSWVREHIPNKLVLIKRLNRHIDHFTFDENEINGSLSLRERIFSLLMKRCDGLQEYRHGMLALLHAVTFNPSFGAAFAAANIESITWVADAAGLNRTGIKGFIRLHALGGLWAHTLYAWRKDESTELEATMIALNEGLDKLEKFNLLIA